MLPFYQVMQVAGAAGDGVTDDTQALQRLLNKAPAGATLDFGDNTYLVGAGLDGSRLSNVKLVGQATLRAKGGTDFPFILDISGTSGIEIEGLTFDANKAQRQAAVGKLSCLKANATRSCRLTGCTFKNSLGSRGRAGTSSVAVSASGACRGLRVDQCRFLDCGIEANDRPSDGIFVRGDDCAITNCYAENVTDHAFVLEGCNNSQITDCTGVNCTSIAGMSNDTASDVSGNTISRIRGDCNYFGSFGGVVGAYAFGAGKLRQCRISDIEVRAADHARGGGGGLYFFGKVEGLVVSNVNVDAGSTSGVMTHGIVIDGVISMTISGSRVRADGVGTCIRLVNASSGVRLEGNRFSNGRFGIYADGTSRFSERSNTFANCHATVGLGGLAARL